MPAASGHETRSVVRARLESASADAIAVRVESPQGTGLLEYQSPEPLWDAAPATLDFVAVALAQFAAGLDSDLIVEGPVTTATLDRLDEYLQIWSIWRPDLFRRVSVRATDEVADPAPTERRGAVMGFSGGVDASFALAAHSSGTMGRLTRQIVLGVLVVGWDIRHGDSEGMERARAAATRTLDEYGVETAVVSTNWQQDFCTGWFMSFNAGLMAILHTLSGGYSSAIHANDHNYRDELKMPPYGSNMAINHLLGTPGFPVISTGGTHRRIERVQFLADHPVLLNNLRVCYQEHAAGGNCGHCEKCVRTQLELRVLGLPADQAFPAPMVVDDLMAATVTNATVLMHFEDIFARMDAGDTLRGPLERWVRRERQAQARRRGQPVDRVADLERQLRAARAEIAAIKTSRSWRVTQPLRAMSDRARGAKDSQAQPESEGPGSV